MFASAHRLHRMLIEQFVHPGHTAGLRIRAAAASDKHVDLLRIEAMFMEHVHDHAVAERNLFVDVIIF